MNFAASPRRRAIAVATLLGVFVLGVFLTWAWIVGLRLPLPRTPIERKLATTVIQGFFAIALPYLFAWKFFGLTPARLGITRRGFWPSLLWGCALYAIAYLAFLSCSDNPLLARHPIRHAGAAEGFAIVSTMGLHAATTDLATRGYILLALAEFSPVWFAVLMQNVVWFVGHVYEIDLLSRCMGLPAARLLFLALGVLGDIVALRTRNVLGLAVAHVLLNVVMAFTIRAM